MSSELPIDLSSELQRSPDASWPPPSPPDSVVQSTLAAAAHRLTGKLGRGAGSQAERMLQRLTSAAVASVPGADYAGLTMRHQGALVSRAPSDPRIRDADQLQVDLAEGPCIDALDPDTSTLVVVADFTIEPRWARFSPVVAEHGIRSLLSFTMAPHQASPGALNLYSTRPDAFDEAAQAVGGAFAQQAAVAVDGAEAVADLERALQSRDEIGQAKGILVERFGLSSEQAFELLVESSQNTNIKLSAVAHWLLTETTSRASTPPHGGQRTLHRPEPGHTSGSHGRRTATA